MKVYEIIRESEESITIFIGLFNISFNNLNIRVNTAITDYANNPTKINLIGLKHILLKTYIEIESIMEQEVWNQLKDDPDFDLVTGKFIDLYELIETTLRQLPNT